MMKKKVAQVALKPKIEEWVQMHHEQPTNYEDPYHIYLQWNQCQQMAPLLLRT
ncbi:hypothetical protein CsSME_00027552 [Camellia sinensis var. sinensis]